jgi:lysozyme
MVEGVDVSRHQGAIDWPVAKRGGITFVYVKLTEGVGFLDPGADAHIKAARAAGVAVGGYHFARPDTNLPEAEANSFAAALKARGLAQPGMLPPCLDMEKSASGVDYVDWSKRFLAALRNLTLHRPAMIYASAAWWKSQYRGGGWLDADTWAWVAHYGADPGLPSYKTSRTVMHQYTDAGRISGYSGNVDRNTCWVDLSTLTGGAAAAAPGTPTVVASGVEIMERITVTPPNANQNTVRVNLSGSPNAAVIVRPRIGGDGYAKPMWVGDIFAWASDHQGVGHNPTQVAGYNNKLTSHRRYELPGALWADINYSASEPFEIDIVG